MGSLDGPHTCFPMLVAEGIAHCIGFGPGAEQTSEVGVGFEITDGKQQDDSQENHGLTHFLVVSPPA